MAAREPLVLAEPSTARSSLIVAGGFLVSTILSASLGLLIGLILGETPETDALLAAYSLYLVFTLFGANLRVALVPILGSTSDEDAFRARAAEVIRRLSTLGAVLALVVLVLSPLIGHLLVLGNEDAAPGVAGGALALLALASYCQIAAAAQGATLAAARRFTASAGLYVASAAVTVAAAAALMPPFGGVGAALGVLCGALVLLAGHTLLLRRHGLLALPRPRAARERETWRLGGLAAGGAGVPLAYQGMLTVSLAALSGAVGTVTAYSYAYFLAALLSSITAASIGFATMPGLVADLERRPLKAARDYLMNVAPIGVFLYVPIAAAVAVFGRPVLDAVLDSALGVGTVDLLWDLARIFLLIVLFWVILTPMPTLALSLHRFREQAMLAIAAMPIHLVLVAVAGAIGGAELIAIGHGIASVGLALAVGVVVFGRDTPAAVAGAVWRSAPAFAFALVFPLLGLLSPDGVVGSLALSVLGVALYLALAALLWPRMRPLMRQLVPLSARS